MSANLYCEILLSVRGLHDKNNASYYYFTSNVMYKWYKRLVYTHPDLLTRFCKVNLSNTKNLAWFFLPGLINLRHAQEPLWLLKVIEDDYQVLGVHMRLSSLWKIWFTLGLFANYFSLKSCSLSLNSHKNVTLVPELFLNFYLRKRSRASREAATTSRESDEKREKILWLPLLRISLSCRWQGQDLTLGRWLVRYFFKHANQFDWLV